MSDRKKTSERRKKVIGLPGFNRGQQAVPTPSTTTTATPSRTSVDSQSSGVPRNGTGSSATGQRVRQLPEELQAAAANLVNNGRPKQVVRARTPPDVFDQRKYDDENWDYVVRSGELFRNQYLLEKVIGRGSFGQVIRAYDTRKRERVAIKIIKSDRPYFQQALQEVRMTAMLQRLDPDDSYSIIRLRDKFIYRGHQCLVFELLSFSLYDLLGSTDFMGVSLKLVRKFGLQILNCLEFLARPSINIIHCDLKPENVLLRHPQRSQIRVVDFGSSCLASDDPTRLLTYVQSRFYRAPEVILGIHYGTQIDVWSLGCMLAELYTGFPLFAGHDEGDQIAAICERLGLPPAEVLEIAPKAPQFFDFDRSSSRWSLREGIASRPITVGSRPVTVFVDEFVGVNATRGRRPVSMGDAEIEAFLDLIHRMLVFDPSKRISPAEAMGHPFFSGATHPEVDHEEIQTITTALGDEVEGEDTSEAARLRQSGRNAPVPAAPQGVGVPSIATSSTHQSDDDVHPATAKMSDLSMGTSVEDAPAAAVSAGMTQLMQDWTEKFGIEPPAWRDFVGRHRDLPERPPSIGNASGAVLYFQQSCQPHHRFAQMAVVRKQPLRLCAPGLDFPRAPHPPIRPHLHCVRNHPPLRRGLPPAAQPHPMTMGLGPPKSNSRPTDSRIAPTLPSIGRGHGILTR